MNLHVRLELVGLMELLLAEYALKGLVSAVDAQVSVEVPVGAECFTTLLTFIGLFSCVDALVLLQAAGLEEPLPAHLTHKGLVTSVAALVVAE